jgi:hypothetical protein
MLFCNGKDKVKVRQGRSKRTENEQVNQGKQMTEEGMVPCSPAERGTPCNRLCCASTGAPWDGYSSINLQPLSSRIELESAVR